MMIRRRGDDDDGDEEEEVDVGLLVGRRAEVYASVNWGSRYVVVLDALEVSSFCFFPAFVFCVILWFLCGSGLVATLWWVRVVFG